MESNSFFFRGSNVYLSHLFFNQDLSEFGEIARHPLQRCFLHFCHHRNWGFVFFFARKIMGPQLPKEKMLWMETKVSWPQDNNKIVQPQSLTHSLHSLHSWWLVPTFQAFPNLGPGNCLRGSWTLAGWTPALLSLPGARAQSWDGKCRPKFSRRIHACFLRQMFDAKLRGAGVPKFESPLVMIS